MIGTHNSLTSYKPRFKIMNLFKWLWRCQDMSFEEQLEVVEYFDIRVRFDKSGKLQFCHGLVDLDVPYSLYDILDEINGLGKCRIVLERGNCPDFLKYVTSLYPFYKDVVDIIVIKKGWNILYGNPIPCKDYTYIPFYSNRSFWDNLKNLRISTIKQWARKHNPNINDNIFMDKIIHFMDYVKID